MKIRQKKATRLAIIALVCVIVAAVGWFIYDNTVDRSGWVIADGGATYYKDFHGRKVTGWQDIEGHRYYFDEERLMVTGWRELDGETYWFTPDGDMVTGWQNIGGETYRFTEEGTLLNGWLELDGNRYYLGEDGAMSTGWRDIDGNRYYFGDDGVMVYGWQDIGRERYYFSVHGIMLTGFLRLTEGTYYFDDTGAMRTGRVALEDAEYLFGEDGKMHTGWYSDSEGIRYYTPEGPMATGWQELDGKRYCFEESGLARTGWYTEGEYSYYFLEDGSAAVGKHIIDGETHYFSPKGIHVVLVNASNKVPSYYKMNLVTVTGWHQVSDVCYDALVKMLADCVAAGNQYTFNSAHRTIAEQTEILELRTKEHMADFGLDEKAARAKALQTVALPGTSEHHLGLAVDLLGDAAIAWFNEHCWDYGFIVRYTEEKSHITGIISEPWHFRYVGTEVSLDMKDSGLCLEEYLGAVPIESTNTETN